MAAMFVELPREIMEDIMSRLSPKWLLRLTCVGKSLHRLIHELIRDPGFVNKHLQRSKRSCLVFTRFNDMTNYSFSAMACGIKVRNIVEEQGSLVLLNKDDDAKDEYPNYVIDNFQPLIVTYRRTGTVRGELFLVGHCDGVMCVANHALGRIALFNPATRDAMFIINKGGKSTVMVGFGYDPIASVYKFVRVFNNRKAQTCTLGNECWRDIKSIAAEGISSERQVECRGVCYWLVSSNAHTLPTKIQAFDLHDEEFYSLPMPGRFENEPCPIETALLEWNETSVIFVCPDQRHRPITEIWMLMHDNDNGGRRGVNWSKYVTIDLRLGRLLNYNPLAYLKADNELLMKDGGRGFMTCNLSTFEMTYFKLGEPALAWGTATWAFPYVQSLVSLGRRRPCRLFT